MKLYVGLDQALANVGWAVATADTECVLILSYGTLRTKAGEQLYKRLEEIEALIKLLAVNQAAECVFTERVFFGKFVTQASIDLIRVETVIHQLLYKHKVPVKILDANSNSSKSWRRPFELSSQKSSAKRLFSNKLNKLTEHSADAVGILLAGLVHENVVRPEVALNFNYQETI